MCLLEETQPTVLRLGWVQGMYAVLLATAGETGRDSMPAAVEPYGQLVHAILHQRPGEVETAAESLAPSPWRRHYALRLAAEAAVSGGWGRPADWLAAALEFFGPSGHAASVAACKGLLRRSGVSVARRGRGTAVEPALEAVGITSREGDVLRLVSDGLSNREIAERLYLSPRTVESHVASLMRKATVKSRAALAAFARDRLP